MMRAVRLVAVALVLALAGTRCRNKPPVPIEAAATPEAAESGLVQTLIARFEQKNGVTINLRTVPKDEAYRLAGWRAVQVVFTTEPKAILRYSAVARLAEPLAYHDFALFGPREDPAPVAMAASGADALRRIDERKARFCSAAGVVSVRQREAQLWKAAGIDPSVPRWRSDCGGDLSAALLEAAGRSAYTLSEAKAAAGLDKHMDIKLLLQGSSDLHDEYSVMLIEHTPRIRPDRDAEWFVEWLMSYQGREAIQSVRFDGIRAFSVRDADGR